MKKIKSTIYLILIFALFLPSFASAASPDGGGTGIYTKAAVGDPSLAMISKIVGGVPGIFPGEDSPLTPTFLVFNTSILAIAVAFLLWNFGSGVIQTAHEGEFLGKRFSSIWMPIRNVTGIGGLIPAFGGWSACQIVMMWAVTIGIGLANLTWQAGYTAMLGYVSHPITSPTLALNDSTMQAIIKAQTCMIGQNEAWNAVKNEAPPDKIAQGWTPNNNNVFDNQPRFRQHGPVHTAVLHGATNFLMQTSGVSMVWGGQGYNDYPKDICGGVEVSSVNALQTMGKMISFFRLLMRQDPLLIVA